MRAVAAADEGRKSSLMTTTDTLVSYVKKTFDRTKPYVVGRLRMD